MGVVCQAVGRSRPGKFVACPLWAAGPVRWVDLSPVLSIDTTSSVGILQQPLDVVSGRFLCCPHLIPRRAFTVHKDRVGSYRVITRPDDSAPVAVHSCGCLPVAPCAPKIYGDKHGNRRVESSPHRVSTPSFLDRPQGTGQAHEDLCPAGLDRCVRRIDHFEGVRFQGFLQHGAFVAERPQGVLAVIVPHA